MRKHALLVLAGALLLGLAVPVLAAIRKEHTFSAKYTTKKPGVSTGIKFSTNRVGYKVPAPGTQADPVTKLVFTLQKGTKIKTSVVPACSLSKLKANTPCPTKSKIGSGKAKIITGLPALDPVNEKVQLFAQKKGIIAYLTGLQTAIIPLSVSGNKLTAVVPRVCLPGGTPADNCKNGEAVLTVLSATIPAKKTSKGALMTAPRPCPANKKWTSTATYTFSNGDTEKETSTSPCR